MSGRPFLVFDLDGTLIDGYEAIADALAYAMERLGETPLPLVRVRRMVGHGLESLLEEAVGTERAAEGVRLFRERYPEVAVGEVAPPARRGRNARGAGVPGTSHGTRLEQTCALLRG